MKIYTSYFAKLGKVKNPISICAKAPDWYKGSQYKTLAPKHGFFKDYKEGKIGIAGYTKQFNSLVLSPLIQSKVVEDLQSFYPDADEITLLCYEKPNDFCHRHLVADWLSSAGFVVEEKDV